MPLHFVDSPDLDPNCLSNHSPIFLVVFIINDLGNLLGIFSTSPGAGPAVHGVHDCPHDLPLRILDHRRWKPQTVWR